VDEQGVIRSGAPLRISGAGESRRSCAYRAIAYRSTHLPADYPRLGESLEEFAPREVRRILVGHFEMRYEIVESVIYVLRLWHTREDR